MKALSVAKDTCIDHKIKPAARRSEASAMAFGDPMTGEQFVLMHRALARSPLPQSVQRATLAPLRSEISDPEKFRDPDEADIALPQPDRRQNKTISAAVLAKE